MRRDYGVSTPPKAHLARQMAREITYSASDPNSKLRGKANALMEPSTAEPKTEIPVEIADTRRATIEVKDGMLVVDFTQTSYNNCYENIQITETEKGIVVVAEKQVWRENGWLWLNFFDNYEGAVYLPRDMHLLHPSMIPLLKTETKETGWPWNRKRITSYYVNSKFVRVDNRPRRFESSNYTVINR
jgi:hypothetical protein